MKQPTTELSQKKAGTCRGSIFFCLYELDLLVTALSFLQNAHCRIFAHCDTY